MKKVSLWLTVLVSLLVIVNSCGQPQQVETSPLENKLEEAIFRVEVSRNGFNNTPGEFRLEVEEGQEVEITFVYGDGDFPQNNPHIIGIPDYGIETGVLDEGTPEVTMSFTASSREVVFKCLQLTCVGHPNLQNGHIVPHSR